ncbi:hypothetical protein T492DRAFT_834790 [Pavlovales sp. CCMP2436]|nr:hypothetical protein T492DRAFT_834790 [Pavlovales sp. CCMP2436]
MDEREAEELPPSAGSSRYPHGQRLQRGSAYQGGLLSRAMSGESRGGVSSATGLAGGGPLGSGIKRTNSGIASRRVVKAARRPSASMGAPGSSASEPAADSHSSVWPLRDPAGPAAVLGQDDDATSYAGDAGLPPGICETALSHRPQEAGQLSACLAACQLSADAVSHGSPTAVRAHKRPMRERRSSGGHGAAADMEEGHGGAQQPLGAQSSEWAGSHAAVDALAPRRATGSIGGGSAAVVGAAEAGKSEGASEGAGVGRRAVTLWHQGDGVPWWARQRPIPGSGPSESTLAVSEGGGAGQSFVTTMSSPFAAASNPGMRRAVGPVPGQAQKSGGAAEESGRGKTQSGGASQEPRRHLFAARRSPAAMFLLMVETVDAVAAVDAVPRSVNGSHERDSETGGKAVEEKTGRTVEVEGGEHRAEEGEMLPSSPPLHLSTDAVLIA